MHVVFKPKAQIQDSGIRLGDVAELSPEHAQQRYADLELFSMRDNRSVQTYRTSTLRAYIQQRVGDTVSLSWGGADEVLVRRAGGELIEREVMLEQVRRYLEKQFDHPAVSRVEFVPHKFPEPFVLHAPNWECTVRPARETILSSRRFSLVFKDKNRVLRTVRVRGEVRVSARVAVASQNVHRGQTLERRHVELQERELSGRTEPIFERQEAVGKRAENTMRAGSMIEGENVARPYLVRRREQVNLIVRKGKMIISATGIAREDGAKMDRVCVENAQSGQEVYGKVVASDTVEVAF